MKQFFTRRSAIAATGLMLAAAAATGAMAQDKPVLRYSAVFSEQDIRATMIREIAAAMADDFTIQPYFGGTLFNQGTELVALQRNNLELSNISAQEIAGQIPAWSIVTSAYLFRDAAHLKTFFDSDVGGELKQMAEDQLGIHIVAPVYAGVRHIGLKPDRKINTPQDMAGIRLRMPPSETWQFLGEALGASPTPMAFAEVYTGLQTNAIDGQDNPLPNVTNMKFYEVMSQIALTSHLVAFDILSVSSKVWNGMTPQQQVAFEAATEQAAARSAAEHLRQESELVEFLRGQGLKIYVPDVAAFRAYAQEKYLNSPYSADWPAGMLDRINGL